MHLGKPDQGFLVELRAFTPLGTLGEIEETTPTNPIQREVEEFISEYADVFQTPKDLPPPRDIDHRIQLKEEKQPINIRSYRYPHIQKAEIEKMITEMLAAGIIRPSVSPYFSPVIFVKKKDGSWRFCVDYRAVSNATVPDKFPMPVIEEPMNYTALRCTPKST